MSWLHACILIIGMVWVGAQNAHASIIQKGGGGLGLGRSGPNTARGSIKPTGSDFDNLLRGPAKLDGGRSDFDRLLDLPFKLPDIPADKATVKGFLSPANLGKALRGGVGGYVAGEAFKRLADLACVRLAGGSMQPIPSGAWEECVPGQATPASDGYEYSAYNSGWKPTALAACQASIASAKASLGWAEIEITRASVAGNGTPYCYGRRKVSSSSAWTPVAPADEGLYTGYRRGSACPAGKYVWADGSCHSEPQVSDTTWRPITTDQAQQKFENVIKNDANKGIVWDAVRDYWDKGGPIEIDQPLSVIGPAQSPASTSTTTTTQQTANGPQTTTTTNTTVINYNYSGDTVTVNQTTTNITRNQAGDVISSSTTTKTPEASDSSDEAPTDTPLPPVPDLYVRKYPNGMEGIYDQYKDQLKAAALVQLAKKLMPSVGDSGTCPSWPLNLDLAEWAAYGTHDVAPPCWIWDVARAILILSALLLARALIFGG